MHPYRDGGHVLGDLAAIAEGEARGFQPFGTWEPGVIVVRRGGTIFAWRNRCPHAGTPLDWVPDRFLAPDGRHLMCATHGAMFVPETGLCVQGPCRGDRLEPVRVEIREGRIVVWAAPPG